MFLLTQVLLLDFTENAFEKAILVQILSVFLINASSYHYLFKNCKLRLKLPSSRDVSGLLRQAFEFYAARLFVNIYNQSSTYLVSLVLKSEQVAIYSIGIQFYKLGQAMIGAVARVLYTRIVKSKAIKSVVKTTLLVLILQAVLLPVVFIYGQQILAFALEVQSPELIEIIKLFYVSLFFVIVSSFWGYPVMVAYNKTKYAHAGIFFTSFVYFLAYNIILISFEFDLVRAALCILVADIVSMLVRVLFAYKVFIIEHKQHDF